MRKVESNFTLVCELNKAFNTEAEDMYTNSTHGTHLSARKLLNTMNNYCILHKWLI